MSNSPPSNWRPDPVGPVPSQTDPSYQSHGLTSEQLAMLQSIDPDLVNSFHSPDFLEIYSQYGASPLTPDATSTFTPQRSAPPTEVAHDANLEIAMEAIQRHLEILTKAKAKKDMLRGREGDQNPNDPVDLLLSHGFRALLHKVVELSGQADHPGILVTFDSLTLKARTFEGTNVIATNGNQLLHMLTFWRRHRTAEKYILRDVSGSFRPGKTTLLLGPPRSGKSTLMKAIAGRLGASSKLEGTVEYAGLRLQEKSQSKGGVKLVKLVGYVPQIDEHIPTLTVRETLRFAHNCTFQPTKKEIQKQILTEKEMSYLGLLVQISVEVIMALLGIRHVGDTAVGNEVMRGISGGQRKRLTTGEILMTRPPVLLADEISTGLDSTTTFDICNTLKAQTRCVKSTIVVSLLQPTPETYATFDEVIVMAAGHIAYQGPRHEVLPYFKELGFHCPESKDAAEFLQEVTLPVGMEKYRVPTHQPWYAINTPEDFGPAWQNSRQFRARVDEDAELYGVSKKELDDVPVEGLRHHRLTSSYTTSIWRSVWLCLRRQAILTARNKQVTRGRLMQMTIGGLLLGSLFFQLEPTDFNSRYAVLFFSMIFVSVSAFALIPGIMQERRVIYRQTDSHFYHPLPYSIAASAVDIPLGFTETLIFTSIMYWMCGFSPNVGDFFLSFLSIFLVKLAMGSLFRVLAGLAPNGAIAQALASIMVVLLVVHGGYFLAQSDVKPWWIWIYWINPLQYGMTSLALIQFHASQYLQLRDPANPSLGTWGDFYLEVKKMPTDDSRLYLGFVYNCCFYFGMVIIDSLVLAYLRWPEKFPPQPPPPTEGLQINDSAPMPFIPCTLAWKSINYDVDIPGKRGPSAKLGLRLLNNVSGFAKPGTMTALMGSSGAGKTTLLDVLAGRKNTGRVEGAILLNGQTADPVTFSRFAGYVEQMDIHSPSMTVAEALRFSALLRLPREVPDADKEAFVWQVISMLNLQCIAHCAIGTRQNGLSVEQVKRVTIGVEVSANPAVLFLDEPTSGLDSMAADVVMDALKAVASTGRTLICTIHQPSSYLFSMFGHLLLLTRGGKTVFFGETGENSTKLVDYFSSIPGAPQHDGEQNPATWMLNVLATEGIEFDKEYSNSDLCKYNEEELEEAMKLTGEKLAAGHLYQATFGKQFKLLLQKWWRLHWRTPGYNLSRFFTCIIIALLMGSIFWQTKGTDQQSVFTRLGLQFMVFLFMGVLHANTIQGVIATERTVFYREKAAHMYHPIFLNIAMGFTELPYITFNCLIFSSIFYWMVGLNANATDFFFWYFVFWLYILYYTYFGLFLGCIMPTAELATVVAGAATSLGSLLAGFMLPKLSIPWWWRWLYYMNPMAYALQPPLSSQFYCAAADADPSQPGDCPTFEIHTINGGIEVVPVWNYVRDAFNLNYEDRWLYIAILFCCIAISRFSAGLALTFVNHAKR